VQILHIATVADWDAAVTVGRYTTSTYGVTIADEGFIHASTAEQVQTTATRYYAALGQPLVVLVMDEDRLQSGGVPVRHEEIAPGLVFPHLYAALPVDLVDEVRPAYFDHAGYLVF
jgi:glutathione S-transferase